jgi:esterase/lipase/1-acyl-sn-glycerol-3-phosphate acyltransferase
MRHEQTYVINEEACGRYLHWFEMISNRLGLNIKVHGDEQLLHDGQIYLFNHFARFETLVPPYILNKKTGQFCRAIAHHALFKVNDNLTNFLVNAGAVPNNIPGLLPFMAAEILRGRKVMIFPEGSIIKDKRVVNDKGQLGIFSSKHNEFRKLHRGAAALAVTLEIFKHRILYLFETEDTPRIERWCTSLGLKNADELLKQASKPTLVVPSAITFYPLRVDGNILTKAAGLLRKKLPAQVLDELSIEGNLLLKDTDMDIQLSDPITPHMDWPWWQEVLLRKYFENSVHSLNDLFSLKDNAHGWAERLLVHSMSRETDRVRDAYMKAIYTGLMVNHNHLASCLIMLLLDSGQTCISVADFHKILYLTLKKLQKDPTIRLQRSLAWPDRNRGMVDGINKEWDEFLAMCIHLGLIDKKDDHYHFLPRLKKPFDVQEIRLSNPVAVYANEIAPLTRVADTLKQALKETPKTTERALALHLFNDEIRAYTWNKSHFSQEKYNDVNAQETATEPGEPFLLLPGGGKKGRQAQTGVLLVHGFLASPAELKAFGEKLCDLGHPVMGVRLSGHGTSPWDLHHRSWEDWLNSVRRGHRILSAFAEDIIVVGFSTGAALSLLLAAEGPDNLKGVASVAAPLSVQDPKMSLVPWMNRLNRLTSNIVGGGGLVPFYAADSEHPHINYRHMPLQALQELGTLMKVVAQKLPLIQTRTTILQGDQDSVVNSTSARKIFDALTIEEKSLHIIPSTRHGIINENIGDTHRRLISFIEYMATTEETEELENNEQ